MRQATYENKALRPVTPVTGEDGSLALEAAPVVERGWSHYTVSPAKLDRKPTLHCWCGASIEMRSMPAVDRFVKQHEECTANEEVLNA